MKKKNLPSIVPEPPNYRSANRAKIDLEKTKRLKKDWKRTADKNKTAARGVKGDRDRMKE